MGKRIPILIGLIFLIIAVWVQTTSINYIHSLTDRLEDLAYDVQLYTRILTHHQRFQSSVAIVDLDDKSLSQVGRWPWPRSKMAELISRLQEYGAVVIATDVLFPEKQDNIVDVVSQELTKENLINQQIIPPLDKIKPLFDNDAIFAASLKLVDVVVGISFLPRHLEEGQLPTPLITLSTPTEKNLALFKTEGYISNIPVIQNAAKSGGFINVFPDDDGIIRRVPLLLRYQDNVYPSLALEAARLYLLSDAKLLTAVYGKSVQLEGVQVGSHLVPTDAEGQVIVPFRGKSFTFPYYSAVDVLNKKIPSDALQGKIIFVGTSATGLGDLPATAIQSAFPGVEIQATIADGILTDTFPYKPAWSLGAEISLTVLLGLILVFSFPYLGPRSLSLLILVIPGVLMFANNWLWERTGLIISILIPIVLTIILASVNIIYGYLFETRRRERLKEIFGQYVPEGHINEMLQSSDTYGMSGEEREMTVLFADIRNFTSISEHMAALQLKEMLNEFFTPMTEIIFKYRGTIDKYVGDMIMAFWGAPLKDKRHAQHAIAAALDMQLKVKELQQLLTERGWPQIIIGIGINSGMMNVGDMGSKFRRNYTVIGDAVNLASRVESLSKYYGARIVVTENTARNQKNFIFRQLDMVRVKGKEAGIGIFEVLCRRSESTPELFQEIHTHEEAFNCYLHHQWDKAIELFNTLKSAHPDVKLYSIYLQRLEEFKQTPPAENWDGVFVHTSK